MRLGAWSGSIAALALGAVVACGGSSGDADGGAGDGGGGAIDAPAGGADGMPNTPRWDPADFDTVYDVGPGKPYAEPGEVPWESLGPSTLVRIFWRAEPYAAKWVINTEATAADPLVVTGVPDGGRLPVITGDGAVTRLELDYWNDDRSVIKVGGSSLPDEMRTPSHIYLELLEIRSAHPDYSFTDDGGSAGSYSANAASIHVEIGDEITIRGCTLTDSGNGLFSGSGSSNLHVTGNYLHGNGNVGSAYEHNSYTESLGITFEYNRYGPLRSGADGNNLKDRSAGTVIRYNWIEAGNRQLDLVESDDAGFIADARYRTTYVYGNILVEPDGAGNSQIVHYGGDNGDASRYRKGTLHFYHNTVVSTRTGNTTLVRLSTADESMDARNNIVVATAGDDRLAIIDGTGDAVLTDNWLQQSWRPTHGTLDGSVTDSGTLTGTAPGFVDLAGGDFALASGSPAIGAAGALAGGAPVVDRQYRKHQTGVSRPDDGDPDLGALER